MADKRTAEEIERDLEQTRARLAHNLSQLVAETHPKAVVHRTIAEGKRQANLAIDEGKEKVRQSVVKVKKVFKDESGWNLRSLAIAGGAVAVLVVLVVAKKK